MRRQVHCRRHVRRDEHEHQERRQRRLHRRGARSARSRSSRSITGPASASGTATPLHTTPQNLNAGGEHAILRNGSNCFLNQLASDDGRRLGVQGASTSAIGRSASIRRLPGVPAACRSSASSNLGDAIKARRRATRRIRTRPTARSRRTPRGGERDLEAAVSRRTPARLAALTDAYDAAVASLKKPPPKPVTFAEIDTAYGLDGQAIVTGA